MKHFTVFVAAGLLAVGLAATAEASGRRGYYERHLPEPRISAFWSAPGFAFGFSYPGVWYAPRRAYRPPPRVWVPGYWEKTRVWVPGRYERFESGRNRHRHKHHDHYERGGRGGHGDRHNRQYSRREGRRHGRYRYR
jgi:hypothetical protein